MTASEKELIETLHGLEQALNDADTDAIATGMAVLEQLPVDERRAAATRVWRDLGDPIYSVDPLLHTAAAGGHIEVVERLISWGADLDSLHYPDGPERPGSTALSMACHALRWDDTEAVCLALIRADSEVNCHDFYGLTPLHYAASAGSRRVVQALLAAGTDPDACDTRFDKTPLHYAAEDDGAAAVPLLIEAGAGIDRRDKSARTPLLTAVAFDRKQIVKSLLAAAADAGASDSRGRTCLHFAARHGDDDLVRILASEDTKLDAKDDLGQSPLDILTAFGAHDLLDEVCPPALRDMPALSEEAQVAIFITLILQNTTDSDEYLSCSFIDVLHERDRWLTPRGRRLAAAVSGLGVGDAGSGVVPCALVSAIHHIFWYVDLRYWCHRDRNDHSVVKNLDDDTLYDTHEEFAIALTPYLTRRSGTGEGRTVAGLTRQELAARKISLPER